MTPLSLRIALPFSRQVAAGLLAAAAGLVWTPSADAGDVGVSIGFSQPGVYGRIDIGRYPQPVLIAPQPILIGQPLYREPVYLWVPEVQRRDWRRYCDGYRACGRPVYFVEDGWYRQHVVVDRERGYERRDREDRGEHDNGRHRGRDREDRGDRGEHGKRGHHDD